jgi:hypothetical protein
MVQLGPDKTLINAARSFCRRKIRRSRLSTRGTKMRKVVVSMTFAFVAVAGSASAEENVFFPSYTPRDMQSVENFTPPTPLPDTNYPRFEAGRLAVSPDTSFSGSMSATSFSADVQLSNDFLGQ